jgi:hypothetical protein
MQAQTPAVQAADQQSLAPVHETPVGLSPHVPFLQPEALRHSSSAVHAAPSCFSVTQLPLTQCELWHSASSLHATPSARTGWHVPSMHGLGAAQSAATRHALPNAKGVQ